MATNNKSSNPPTTFIDHITITAPSLEAGAKLVGDTLGISPQTGGEHPKMGTHNLFLRLGDTVFLEVIACNPQAKPPNRPRWFALDAIKQATPALLKTWVIRTDDIHASTKYCAESIGNIEPISRGETHWLITIPEDGHLPINEGAPALIQWLDNNAHPASRLTNHGLSLMKLQIQHPDPQRLTDFLNTIKLKNKQDYIIEVVKADQTRLIATIDTPTGIKKLGL